jgi:hypothetical protein
MASRRAARTGFLAGYKVEDTYLRTFGGAKSANCNGSCAAVGAPRREAVFGPVLTHWDEAAVYGLVGCGAAAFG